MYRTISFKEFATVTLVSALIMWVVTTRLFSSCYIPKTEDNQATDSTLPPEIPTSMINYDKTKVVRHYLNFSYLQPKLHSVVCTKNITKPLMGIIVISTTAKDYQLREIHRRGLSKEKLAELGFQRVFILGQIDPQERYDSDKITQSQIQLEQNTFGDLVQGSFVDNKTFLTAKLIMALQWTMSNCAERAKFIIKVDDYIIYDIFHVRQFLQVYQMYEPNLTKSSRFLVGNIQIDNAQIVERNPRRYWYVSRQEYAEAYYPDFCSGSFFITNPATAMRLVGAAEREPLLWIDDVWVTGILRTRLLIPVQVISFWFADNYRLIKCCLRDLEAYNYTCQYHVAPIHTALIRDPDIFKKYIQKIEKCYQNKCISPPSNYIMENHCFN